MLDQDDTDLHCHLCGSGLGHWNHSERWMQEIRCIYVHDQIFTSVRLTGLARCADASSLSLAVDAPELEPGHCLAPIDPAARYDDAGLRLDNFIDVYLAPRRIDNLTEDTARSFHWGFGFHAFCWDMLVLRAEGGELPLSRLFEACLSAATFHVLLVGPTDEALAGPAFGFGLGDFWAAEADPSAVAAELLTSSNDENEEEGADDSGQDDGGAEKLANARRIWKLAGRAVHFLERKCGTACEGVPIRGLLEPHAAPDPVADTDSDSDDEEDGEDDEDGENSPDRWTVAARNERWRRAIDHGSRALRARIIQPSSPLKRVYVSLVEISGEAHVSGLRFAEEADSETRLGHIRDEEAVLAPQAESIQIRAFTVALSRTGVAGLKAEYSDGTTAAWAGSHEDKVLFRLAPGGVHHTYRGEFDANRLVSFGATCMDSPTEPPEPRDNSPWYPDVPRKNYHLAFHGPWDDHGLGNNWAHSLIPFGGSDGEDLAYLTSIACPNGTYGPCAMVFTFENGDRRWKKHYTAREETRNWGLLNVDSILVENVREDDDDEGKLIDGPGGERITEVHCHLENRVLAILMRTNRGRFLLFSDTDDEFYVTENDDGDQEKCHPESQHIKSEGTIIGFHVIFAEEESLAAFGVISIDNAEG